MAAVNEDMGRLTGIESVSLSSGLMEENSKGQDLQKAAKALLTELEELLSVMVEAQSGSASTVNLKGVNVSISKKGNVEKLVQLLKDIHEGKVPASKLYEVIAQITAMVGSGSKGVKEVIGIATKTLEESGAASDIQKFLKTAKEYTDKIEKGLNSGEVTCEELLGNENIEAFVAGMSGDKGALGASKPKADGSNPSGAGKTDGYKEAIFNLAMTIQSLLADIMNGQGANNKLINECSEVQGSNAKTLMVAKLADMTKEIQDQQKAGQKPWWMYFIAAILAVVGAVIAGFTAGAAAAVVALVIGVIMASPLGDMLTNALVTAMAGPNPTDAQKEGATAGAIAIITVITTILSFGAAGFSGAAEGVADGVMDGAEEGIATAATSVVRAGVTEAAEGLANGLEDGGEMLAAEAAEGAIEQEAQEAVENVIETVGDSANEVADGAQGAAKQTSSIAKSFTKVFGRFDMKSMTTGLAGRFIGTYVQGFVGGGGLTDAIEAIMLSYPAGKAFLQSQTGAIVMGFVAAVLAIAGTVGGGKIAAGGKIDDEGAITAGTKILDGGVAERSAYLAGAGLKDVVLEVSGVVKEVATGLQYTALAAQGLSQMAQYFPLHDLSVIQQELGNVTAQVSMSENNLETLQNMQTRASDSASEQEKTLQGAFTTLLDSIIVESKNQTAAITG